ncbi:MAG: hypothetical protein G01um101418_703 [Parcubacteria group bacterium Gr01-1014_18]|nr:MAG: hypothetical protein Greene041636_843 [Parcubacteria group bacterium Greene0416_36]TSC80284.1 MAG: hypothetical protein G01um101418_703 [Parcubacteria group bacterium Gr01-1014_18]TSC98263.1 MAG: hypothetical protein Greene101420_856 [Parcubacteria group bacterium Greene1014_20]TSD06994.1 MAG: hypothetical protein Greene07142_451 [Parcubacteria group bacterium Greene0714_2]
MPNDSLEIIVQNIKKAQENSRDFISRKKYLEIVELELQYNPHIIHWRDYYRTLIWIKYEFGQKKEALDQLENLVISNFHAIFGKQTLHCADIIWDCCANLSAEKLSTISNRVAPLFKTSPSISKKEATKDIKILINILKEIEKNSTQKILKYLMLVYSILPESELEEEILLLK